MRKLGLGCGLIVMTALWGCGNTANSDDMATPDLAGADLAATPDMAIPAVLNGTKVVTGTAQTIGVNDDGYIIYFPGGKGISGVKLDGTDNTVKIANANSVSVSGKVVFGWISPSNDLGFGELWAWKSGVTAVKVADASLHGDFTKTPRTLSGAIASKDGSRILISTNATETTTDLVVANFDGTNPTTVLTGIDISGACELRTGFVTGKFIVGYCTANAAPDGGIASSSVIAVDMTSGSKTTLFTGVRNFFTVDSAGSKVAAVDVNQQLKWVNINGTGLVTVSPNGLVSKELVAMNAAGTNLVWISSTDQLVRLDVSTAAQTPVVLQTGVKLLLRISPDDSHAFIAKTVDDTTDPMNPSNDIYLVSLTAATTATTLVSTPTGAIFGDAWSLDSSRAFYYTAVTGGVGTLHAQTVTGGTDVVLGTNVWNEYAAVGDKVLFTDNYRSNNTFVDAKLIPGAGGTASVVATNVRDDANGNIRPIMTSDGTKFIYNYTGKPASADGLYVYTVQ